MFKLLLVLILPLLLAVLSMLALNLRNTKSKDLTSGVTSPVKIERDEWGIPHIYAQNLYDAYYGLGYSMCQDRMWQLDVMRRLATGRLSELFGKKTVEVDKFMRNIKIPISAKNDVEFLDDETLRVGKSFVRGINDAALEQGNSIEYWITGSNWQNFTLVDSQAMIYFTSLYLSMFSGTDAVKQQLKALGLDPDLLLPADINLLRPTGFTVDNDEMPQELKGKAQEVRESEFKQFVNFYTELFDEGAGSNAWIIGGNFTKSGKPVLSNDPHLSASIPSVWYLAHMSIPGTSVYGSCSLGSPILAIGRNNHLVWGVTAIKSDDLDIYVEKELNFTHYHFGSELFEYLPFTETIQIKNEPPLTLHFKESVHGPILQNSFIGLKRFIPAYTGPESEIFSFCWSSLGFYDKSMSLSHQMFKVSNIQDYRKAASKVTAIRLSILVGSDSGDIMQQTTGKLPVRRFKGDMFLPGWNPETMWHGYIRFEEMPYVINPSKGFIVTANNFVIGSDYKHFDSLGFIFSQGRIERITEIIEEKIRDGHKFTAEDQVEIMKDEKDLFAEKLVPSLVKRIRDKVKGKYLQALHKVSKWDFFMLRQSQPAAVYAKWSVELAKGILKRQVSEPILQSFMRSHLMHTSISNYFQEFYPDLGTFCDDRKTELVETCDDVILQAFENAVDFVGEQSWGDLHYTVLKHFPFSESPLKYFYERKASMGGWFGTIHATSTDWNSTFTVCHGPGLKFVSDLGNSSSNYWSLESGVSGSVFSSHYSDMFQNFHYGQIPRFTYNP